MIMPELVTCPSCGCKVQVAEMLLGKRTRCIACGSVFLAGEQPLPPEPTGIPLQPDDEDLPSGRLPGMDVPGPQHGLPRHHLPLCPRCHRPVGWEASACPHCGHLFEPEDPRNLPPWPRRRDGEPHRGKMIDTLGSVSLMCGTVGMCLLFIGPAVALATGIPAIVMAYHDLERMQKGLTDPDGRRETELGRNKAIVGVVIAVLVAIFSVIAIVELSR
jgi:hypothetical protein